MRRMLVLLLLLVLISFPVSGQDSSLLDWIPADFAGYVRVDMANAPETLQSLNLGAFIGSVLQPSRVTTEEALTFDNVFPLSSLDVEAVTFDAVILPWLADELIVAYRSMPADYQVSPEDALLMLPTEDPFYALSVLSSVIQAQDLLEQTIYRDVPIYQGDRVSLGVTPFAILIGSDEAIRAVLDTQAGDSPALTSDSVYQAVQGGFETDPNLFVYLQGESAGGGFSYLMSANPESESLFAAIGTTATNFHLPTIETALLNGEVDGLGIGFQLNATFTDQVSATAILHTSDEDLVSSTAEFNATVLSLIPRSALFVESGADAQNAAYLSLAGLPMANFAGKLLSGFPVGQLPDTTLAALALPTADNLEAAVNSFAAAMEATSDIDVFADVIGHLQGSYAFALLPRPNDPLPVLNTPFDSLLVVQVDEGDTVTDTLYTLLDSFAGASLLERETLSGTEFATLLSADTGEPWLRFGVVDDLLIIGTGEAAVLALRAGQGDNRLIDQARWQALSGEVLPTVYVDVPSLYNTFFPTAGGQVGATVQQVGIASRPLDDSLFEVKMEVTLDLS